MTVVQIWENSVCQSLCSIVGIRINWFFSLFSALLLPTYPPIYFYFLLCQYLIFSLYISTFHPNYLLSSPTPYPSIFPSPPLIPCIVLAFTCLLPFFLSSPCLYLPLHHVFLTPYSFDISSPPSSFPPFPNLHPPLFGPLHHYTLISCLTIIPIHFFLSLHRHPPCPLSLTPLYHHRLSQCCSSAWRWLQTWSASSSFQSIGSSLQPPPMCGSSLSGIQVTDDLSTCPSVCFLGGKWNRGHIYLFFIR